MEGADELVQFHVVEIGDGPEGHAVASPVAHLEAAERARVRGRLAGIRSGPHEDVDRVLPALIDERRDGAAGEVIESAADEGKAERREIVDRRGEVQFAEEPRFHGVLIARARGRCRRR
jgi:hypothetical protein